MPVASSTSESAPVLRIGQISIRTIAEGPGTRFGVWAQGCAIRCPGCFNPHLWSALGGTAVDPDELAEQAMLASVDGVTLLGGEPFEQAHAFARFARQVRRGGLSVMTFTGHLVEDLRGPQAPPGAAELLSATDLLVDGPYRADLLDIARPWVGSTNQRFHFLSDRYSHLQDQLAAMPDRLEVRVGVDGAITVNGWSTVADLDDLLAGLTPAVRRGQIR